MIIKLNMERAFMANSLWTWNPRAMDCLD